MSILKRFDPTYNLDKKIEREIEKGTFVPTVKTENGIRGQYLRRRPEIKEKYEKAINRRRKIISKSLFIGAGAIVIASEVFIYKKMSPKPSVNFNVNEFFEKGIDASKKAEKMQQEKMLEDLSKMTSADELYAYTIQEVVNIHNQKNPENQIQMEDFRIIRSNAKIIVTKDKFGNIVSYSTYKEGTTLQENQNILEDERIIKFYLKGEIISIIHENGTQVENGKTSEYDFSKFAPLFSKERYLAYQLNNGKPNTKTDKLLIQEGQQTYVAIVQGLKQVETLETMEQAK